MLDNKKKNDIIDLFFIDNMDFETILNEKYPNFFTKYGKSFYKQIKDFYLLDPEMTSHSVNSYYSVTHNLENIFKRINEIDTENVNTKLICIFFDEMKNKLERHIIPSLNLMSRNLKNFSDSLYSSNQEWKFFDKKKHDVINENIDFNCIKEIETIDKYIAEIENNNAFYSLRDNAILLQQEIEPLSNDDDSISMDKEEIISRIENLKIAIKTDYASLLEHQEISSLVKKMNLREHCDNILDNARKMHSYLLHENNKNLIDSIDFLIKIENNTPLSFIEKKALLSDVKHKIDLPENYKVTEIIQFKDSSVIIKNRDNSYSMISSELDLHNVVEDILGTDIAEKLQKRPFLSREVIKNFKIQIKAEYSEFDNCIIALDTFLNNENILKQENFDFVEYLKANREKSFEKIDDDMNKTINDHNVKKFAHSIVSNKYRNLYDDESYAILKELYDSNFDKKQLQDLIGKKIASFKTATDFNNALEKILDIYNGFDPETVKTKARESNANIVIYADNKLVIRIDNFEQSQKLGSSSWCIARDRYYFNSYTDKGNSQYFIYDFNNDSTNNSCLIGITLDSRGSIYAAHEKNDDEIEMSVQRELKKTIVLDIIKKEHARFPDFVERKIKENKTNIIQL